MKRRGLCPALSLLAVAAAVLSGCEAAKSSNPLSPSLAGPIPGVEITAPKLLEPGRGWEIDSSSQPVTLLLENASTNGARPLTYVFDVAADAGFSNVLFSRTGVAPGDGGRTSLKLPDPLATGRSYYWRARAEDGANTGPYATAADFRVFTPAPPPPPAILEAPAPVSPIGGAMISSTQATLTVGNANRSGPISAVAYVFEISANGSFTALLAIVTIPEQGGPTVMQLANQLDYNKTYYWRVKAYDAQTSSGWSATQSFTTPPPPPPPPPPPSIPSAPSPAGGGGGNWRACGSQTANKEKLVDCVHGAINPSRTVEGAFEVTKRVAWLLRGEGVGLLRKDGGENIVSWRGMSFAAARVCYTNGHIYKILSDVPATNGPQWLDNDFVDPKLYVPAMDPED